VHLRLMDATSDPKAVVVFRAIWLDMALLQLVSIARYDRARMGYLCAHGVRQDLEETVTLHAGSRGTGAAD